MLRCSKAPNKGGEGHVSVEPAVEPHQLPGKLHNIPAAPGQVKPVEALERLLPRFFEAYGPASVEDAAWFFGVEKDEVE